MDEVRLPYSVERRGFDPETLNMTLKMMQKSIEANTKLVVCIKESVSVMREDIKDVVNEMQELDKEFSVCKASRSAMHKAVDDITKRRNKFLFQVTGLAIALTAMAVAVAHYLKDGH